MQGKLIQPPPFARRCNFWGSAVLCSVRTRLHPFRSSFTVLSGALPSPPALPELLVLAWGIFFITKSSDTEPTLKARNFVKVIQRGGGTKKRKRRKIDPAAEEEAGHGGARPPDWDSGSDDDGVRSSGASDSGVSDKVRQQ